VEQVTAVRENPEFYDKRIENDESIIERALAADNEET
jgi:hypothetical protein